MCENALLCPAKEHDADEFVDDHLSYSEGDGVLF